MGELVLAGDDDEGTSRRFLDLMTAEFGPNGNRLRGATWWVRYGNTVLVAGGVVMIMSGALLLGGVGGRDPDSPPGNDPAGVVFIPAGGHEMIGQLPSTGPTLSPPAR